MMNTDPRRFLLVLFAIASLASPIARAQEQPDDQGGQPTSAPRSPAPDAQPADPAPPATVDPAAKDILQAMSDAIAKAASIRANIKTTVTGSLANVTPSTEAVVRMRKPEAASGWLIRVTGTGTRAGQPTNFDVAWGGGSITWLDHKEKKLVGRPQNEARGGSYAMASQAMPTQIIESPPFNKELAGEEISLAGTEDADGQTCDVLHVRYPKRKTLLKLWIAQSDHMLRKLERSTETTKITSTTVQELTDVALNKEIPDAELTIAAPDGYTSDITTPQRFEQGRPIKTRPPSSEASEHSADATLVTPPGATQPGAPPTTQPAPSAANLPSFQLTLSDGTTLSDDSLRGKPAILVFWGTWSLPSRDALEPLCRFAASLREHGVPVIACAVRERSQDAAAEFLKGYQPRNRTGDDRLDTGVLKIAGSADALARELTINRYPTMLAIDAQGRIVKRLEGFNPTKTIEELRSSVAP